MTKPGSRTLATMFALLSPSACVAAADIGGQVTLATDYTYRGVSQTMAGPALQGGLEVDHGSGWYAWGWASNIDFTEDGGADDGASVELDVGAGYAWSVTDRVGLSAGTVVYLFPGTVPGVDYDYLEWQASVDLDERFGVSFGFSDDTFGSGLRSTAWALTADFDVSDRLRAGVEIGRFDLADLYGVDYGYANLSLSGSLQSFDWQFRYVMTTDAAASVFPETTTGSRVVLSLSYVF